MQNSHPHLPSTPTPLSLDDALARAYERAVQRMRSGGLGLAELLAACVTRGDEHPDEKIGPRGTVSPTDPAEPRDDGGPVDRGDPNTSGRATLDELLSVFREPIAWVLGRAERHAQGDPVDLAALDRVGAAFHSRLAWIHSDGVLGEARPRFRAADLLTVAGLIAGSFDPIFAARSSGGLRETFLDALAHVIPLGAAYAPSIPSAPRSASPLGFVELFSGASLPFGAPRPPCAAMPVCCCRHGHLF